MSSYKFEWDEARMEKQDVSRWEMAIGIYMFHLNMTRDEACYALGIKGKNEINKPDTNKEKHVEEKLEIKN
ncbi:hypothetical protein [Vibrio campbellii]|uniref:Uncharacterized protein n=2 Tax=Vibrio campbellii TaxID=680 RepID=A7MTK8_VIBC1|nr:hypothetical protein [Vibrio campbellii]ABU70599.1 hypothetical protein VIBHAR_01630 [Vibrio campbellii ATCC BAA-1116]